jgi:hypothetical protein
MAEERVRRGAAGPAQRQPRRRGRLAAPAAAEAARPDLDARERNMSPRRKPMGPTTPPEEDADTPAAERAARPEVPPTDPQ